MDEITVDALIERWGSQAAVAERCGVTPGAVWQWRRAGAIPPLRQYQVRALLAAETRPAGGRGGRAGAGE